MIPTSQEACPKISKQANKHKTGFKLIRFNAAIIPTFYLI